jgi:S-adenosylmethionine synthetase
MATTRLFTSESVSGGHPDKVADQISDAVLDWALERDSHARVACEAYVAPSRILVGGEVSSTRFGLDDLRSAAPALVAEVLSEVGYGPGSPWGDLSSTPVDLAFSGQSDDIQAGIILGDGALGAGDQGMMFGHACDETPERLPLAIQLAHKLLRRHAEARLGGLGLAFGPDAKSQVTVRYGDDGGALVRTVVLSTQHSAELPIEEVRRLVRTEIVDPVVGPDRRTDDFELLVNPAGRFVLGGPAADVGLTGRKIVADTYGGSCPHGGGAFSGKDATKVDRSGAYAARHVAKNVVAAGLASACTLQLAYAIGRAEPVSLHLDLRGPLLAPSHLVEEAVRRVFDLTPSGIIERLRLREPGFRALCTLGHFGRPEPTWEQEDAVDELRRVLSEIAPPPGAPPEEGPAVPSIPEEVRQRRRDQAQF